MINHLILQRSDSGCPLLYASIFSILFFLACLVFKVVKWLPILKIIPLMASTDPNVPIVSEWGILKISVIPYMVFPRNQPTCLSSLASEKGHVRIFCQRMSIRNICNLRQLKTLLLQPFSSSTTIVTHNGNSMACLSKSMSVGPWISDSGASDHIAGNPSLFSQISLLKLPRLITFAHGSKAKAIVIAQAQIGSSVTLESVLFIPGCPFNIISVSRLTRSLNCSITFAFNSFSI